MAMTCIKRVLTKKEISLCNIRVSWNYSLFINILWQLVKPDNMLGGFTEKGELSIYANFPRWIFMPNSPEYRLRLLSHACPLHGEHVPNVISVHPYRAGNWSLNVSPFHSISMHAGKESKEQCQLCLYVNNFFLQLALLIWSMIPTLYEQKKSMWVLRIFTFFHPRLCCCYNMCKFSVVFL